MSRRAKTSPRNAPPQPSSRASRATLAAWLATSLICGAVIMVLEMVAFRLYAPYFGYSIYVWGNMISVVMAALAIGYAFGGKLADRSQSDGPLYAMILASALYQLVILFSVRSLLPRLAGAGELTGSVLATLIVFTPPMIALATVAPFLIRLLARAGHVGSTAGAIYSLSTIGSIAGVVATTFLLVPRLGTQGTMAVACATSTIVGVAGLCTRRKAVLVALLPLVALLLVKQPKYADDVIWQTESAYNLVLVRQRGDRRALALNHPGEYQTIRDFATGQTDYYYDTFALGPLLVPARRVLVLGAGAGASIAATRRTAPDAEIDAVEIDAEVIATARRFFELKPEEGRLRIHIADARPWLARQDDRFDIVHLDLYQGGLYVPFYLVTEEFFRLVRSRMSDDGLLMMNVLDPSKQRRLLDAIAATMRRVFPSLLVISPNDGKLNYMVLAFSDQRSVGEVRARLARASTDESLKELVDEAAKQITLFETPPSTPVFTDDHAPIEAITHEVLAKYRTYLKRNAGSDPRFPEAQTP